MTDLESLKQERDELQEMLRAHLLICSNPDPPTHQPTNQEEADTCLDDDITTVEVYTTNRVTSHVPPSDDSYLNLEFSKDASDMDNGIVIEPDSELSEMLENSHGFYYTGDSHIIGGDVIDVAEKSFSIFPDDVCYTDIPPEMCYEEVVMDETDYSKQRLDSCSSVATYDSYLSESQSLNGSVPDFGQSLCESSKVFRDVTDSLSDSTCDVRHSISSAYSRVHMDSTSSDVFEMRLLDHDFLLSGEETP